ncbi:MAG: hypothetical protein GXZ11_04500 [Tissierellia bacterium]|nr:hypothetical protein [Tissierellia bacterium]
MYFKWYEIVLIFIVMTGSISMAYQIYRMVALDAKCRGLKHPRFWGIFSISGNSGGLLLYLFGRNKYANTMSAEQKEEMELRKKRAGISLLFLVVALIPLIGFLFIKN